MQPEQVARVRGDLGVTQQNMAVFSEMLAELQPGMEHPEDRSMFEALHATCRAMQTRLVELIDQVLVLGMVALVLLLVLFVVLMVLDTVMGTCTSCFLSPRCRTTA